jgi:hypothetical protein
MLIFDLEADGLLDELTRIHTLHLIDTEKERALRFNEGFFADGSKAPRDGCLAEGIGLLSEADDICGHNIIGYDLPAILKLHPDFTWRGRLHDTMVYARLIWPDLKQIDQRAMSKGKRPDDFGQLIGSHKLEAWGIRLGVLKGTFDGPWEHFTPIMEDYAEQDPVVTRALWNKIVEKGFCEEAARLEHDVQVAITMQERFGFGFNREAAEKLHVTLLARKAELEDELRSAFKPWVEPERYKGQPVVKVAQRRTKVRRWDEDGNEYHIEVQKGETYEKLKLVSFNPASRPQIANRLIQLYGWTPVEFTETGQPKVDETTLGALDHIPAAQVLIDYLTVEKRLGQLATGKAAWLGKVRDNGRIHGRVNTLGAITRRMTHSDPNVAQVPSIKNAKGVVPFGKECRELFYVPLKTRLLCGCDAEGLELRMLGHYMAKYDGGAYADAVVNGDKSKGTDVHTVNQKIVGLNSRESAKTFIYAYLYGAGNLKLGSIIYEDMKPEAREAFNAKHEAGAARERALTRLGLRARTRIEEGLPALGALQDRVKKLSKRGYLKTLDGGRLKVRAQHSALNTLLQGGGAIVMKKALVILFNNLVDLGFEPNLFTGELRRGDQVIGFVANVHDEFQMEVPEELAEEIGNLAADAIRRAGEAFDLRCPLAGSFAIGRTWADTH